jgi:hypothetical protein
MAFIAPTFSLQLQLLNGIAWRSPVPNFMKIGQEVWTVRGDVYIHA